MFCIPINAFISKSVIISGSFLVLTGWLYALCKSAINVIFAVLSLILNCPSFKLAVAVYKGLPIGRSLPCVPYDLYIPVWSSNVARRRFWPIKA